MRDLQLYFIYTVMNNTALSINTSLLYGRENKLLVCYCVMLDCNISIHIVILYLIQQQTVCTVLV